MLGSVDPPGRRWLEQLRQAWELLFHQLCPQGWEQHSSRLPAEALTEPACSWQYQVAKQWLAGPALARAVVGRRENGEESDYVWGSWDSQPGLLPSSASLHCS